MSMCDSFKNLIYISLYVLYQIALEKSSYWKTLMYDPDNVNVNNNKLNRKGNII